MSELEEIVETQSIDQSEPQEEKIDFNNFTLHPDHPILEPFQRALKEHLQAQIARMKADLYEIEDDVRKKEAEIVDVGVQAYEAQQQVCYQQKVLDNIIVKIKKVSEDQDKNELDLKNTSKELKEIQNKLFQAEKTNRELTVEIESVTALHQQLSASENKIESHITINKMMMDKSRQVNDKLAKKKIRQDYLIHHILTDIWNIETEIETGKLQINMKEEELEDLEQREALGSTNITALNSELKALWTSWTSVVAAISNRNKGLECLTYELNNRQERHKQVLNEIEQSKKEIKKTQLENQKFTALKERVLGDIKMSQCQIEEHTAEKKSTDLELQRRTAIIDRLNDDIQICKQESHMKTLAYNKVEQDYKSLADRKYKIDQEIFECIQGEIANDVYGKKARKTLKELSDKIRDVEVILKEVENKKSIVLSEIESEKFKIDELTRIHEETKDEMAKLDTVSSKMAKEKKVFEFHFRMREKQVLKLNETLEEKISNNELDTIARAEMKIAELTKFIEESQQAIKTLKIFWTREQKNLLSVSKERQDQIQEISLLKKQVLILEQKNIQVFDKVDKLRNREEKTQHSINLLTKRAEILCDMVYKSKTKKDCLDRDNTLLQGEYGFKLKDAELELLQIEAEIVDIEEEKQSISQELIAINREGLEWEKKFHVARDTAKNFRHNQKCGDNANLRMEIHKMQVIREQQRKTTEKLVKDLQQTMLKRNCMFEYSEMRRTFDKLKKNDKSRTTLQKKIVSLKIQIKQVNNETQSKKTRYKQVMKEFEEARKKRVTILKEPVLDKEYKSVLKKKLDDCRLNRQFKFEMLVFQQKKAKMYTLIAENRTPYTVYRKEADLIEEYHKQKDINKKLLKVTENLKLKNPDIEVEVQSLCNTLAIVSLCMYT